MNYRGKKRQRNISGFVSLRQQFFTTFGQLFLCYPLLRVIGGLLVGPVHGELSCVHLVAGSESAGDFDCRSVQCIDVICYQHVHAGTAWKKEQQRYG